MLTSSEMRVVLREYNCDCGREIGLTVGRRRRDSIRSLVVSQRLLGTREIAVFHHTDCGMQTFTTPELREKLKGTAEGRDAEQVAAAADAIQFLEFSDLEKSVKEEVEFVKAHPLIFKETEVTGWIYHVETGRVRCGQSRSFSSSSL